MMGLAAAAGVAELEDAPDLGSGGETRGGSSPLARIGIRYGSKVQGSGRGAVIYSARWKLPLLCGRMWRACWW
jgi:hypothetical protein